MIKKAVFIFFCVIIFSISVFAEQNNNDTMQYDPRQLSSDFETINEAAGTDNEARISGQNNEIQIPDFSGERPSRENMPQGGWNMIPEQNGGIPAGDFRGNRGDMPNFQNPTSQVNQDKSFIDILKEYFTPILSLILLAFAFLFVIFYKRKKY